ncbi:PREDICTED: pre-mRNA-splicing factor CWC25 homolog [Camelina sativa]|uniref:Pre-mRNA-splicing factor CWC25 homolog n=1 Tax=Camelina sativa TaxID=90675 RepID=A0ABM1RNN3_CAMSA|nr:PREDICTED: pre-mRNA-splicing factor CWC25 homolog [Camelina sativa]
MRSFLKQRKSKKETTMALKFLNKKGWHTGTLRNIEKVWKAEQKHEAEQKTLEELRLQIQQEKERSELGEIKEQAGLVPKRQERVEFMYDSELLTVKENARSSGHGVSFQNQNQRATADASCVTTTTAKNKKQKQSVPGALFDDYKTKTHFANDSWRKSHSDPLLLIRQQELAARKSVKRKVRG